MRQREKTGRRVLICGASFAGLATAWWLHRMQFEVTVIEIAPGLRKGGTPVDIREGVIEVVRRMGLLERIIAASLPPRSMEFLDASGTRVAGMAAQVGGELPDEAGHEIERDDLLDMLYEEVKDTVQFRFGETIARLDQTAQGVDVSFAGGSTDDFDLVVGCDGVHSAVRRLCFGQESRFSVSLKTYVALSIVPKLLIEENTSQLFNLPGRTVMLNAYHGKTDIGLGVSVEEEIGYDRRNTQEQRQRMHAWFAGTGWRVPELLEEMDRCDNFYFDKVVQIRMPAWSQGRVVLVGDAGYCPSPAAGMGGSMALLGAAALADALRDHPESLEEALKSYDERLRPTVEMIQTEAAEVGIRMFAPRTEEEIQSRNAQLNSR